jgi:hypothetical protein
MEFVFQMSFHAKNDDLPRQAREKLLRNSTV